MSQVMMTTIRNCTPWSIQPLALSGRVSWRSAYQIPATVSAKTIGSSIMSMIRSSSLVLVLAVKRRTTLVVNQ